MDIKDVKALNERIEVIKKKKDKADMQREILSSKLDGEIAKYKEAYGVDLSGADFDTVKHKIESELHRVVASIQEEYDLKLKVVSAIESGNIDEANALLGTEEKSTKAGIKAPEEHEEPISKDVVDDIDDDFGVEEDDFGVEADDDFGFEDEDDSSDAPDVKGISFAGNADDEAVSDGISIDDDDFDLFVDEQSDSSEGTPNRIEVDDDLDFDDLSIDDEDDVEDDFGFGSMLKGTKFGG